MPEIPASPKTAVILFNLGGPLKQEDIRPFLFRFFMDKNIIGAPYPIRILIALWISWSRGRGAAKSAYGLLGDKSPLLENTQAQAKALEEALQQGGTQARVFVSMRYWHPDADAVAKDVAAWQPEKIVLLPLYPQYSTTTTGSSLQDWKRAAEQAGLSAPVSSICCYPEDTGFIAASADLIRKAQAQAPADARLLFSAHGLPEKIIAAGDPYQRHCERTAAAIVRALDIPGLDWQLCYQSRIGPLKWIGPSTTEALEMAAKDGRGVIIYPLAFVSEHVETLVEIELEYRHLAEQMGISSFTRVPTVSTHPAFIQGLRRLVLQAKPVVECGRASQNCPCKRPCGEK